MFSTEKKSGEQSSDDGVEIFSLSESKLSELLKEIKEKYGSGRLPSDEIGRLISHLDSIVGKLLTIQHGSSHDLIKKVMAAIKSAKGDLEHWDEHIKILTEAQERLKKLTGDAIEREREGNDKAIKRLVTELDRSFENIRERDKEARLLANAQVEEFIKRSQAEFSRLLDEQKKIREQIKVERAHFDILNKGVLDSGFLEAIQAAHPSILLQTIRDEYNKYWSDPKIRTKKIFNRFAESLGIGEDEINVHVSKHKLADKVQGMQGSKTATDVLESEDAQVDIDKVEKLLKIKIAATSDILTPEKKQKALEVHNEMLSECDLATFTAFFEQRSQKIAAITSELESIPKNSTDEVAQAKRKDLEEEMGFLLEDLNGLTQLVRQRFGEESPEFKAMQGKVAAFKSPVIADVSPVVPTPAAQLQGAVLGGTTAAVSPAQPQGAVVPEEIVEAAPTEADEMEKELKLLDEEEESLNQRLSAIDKKLEDAASIAEAELDELMSSRISTEEDLSACRDKRKHLLETKPLEPKPSQPPTPSPVVPEEKKKEEATKPPVAPVLQPVAQEAEAKEEEKKEDPAITPVASSPQVTPGAATPPPAAPPVTPAAPAAEAEAAPKVKAAADILTFERAHAIAVKGPDPNATAEAKKAAMVKSCVEAGGAVISQIRSFEEKLQEVGKPLADDMRQEFCSMMADLKGSLLPIYDLDFTKPDEAKKKIEESVDKTLPSWEDYARKSGIDPETQDDKVLKAKQEFENLRSAIIALRVQQYAIGATDGMDIEASGANTDIEWKKRIEQLRDDQYYKDVAATGLADKKFAKELQEKSRGKDPHDYLDMLRSQAKEVAKGLYVKLDESGSELYILHEINADNVQRVIDAKKSYKQIDWSNVAKERRLEVESQCLANWKRASFDGKRTPLSELMPPRKGDWSGWVKAITEKKGMGWFSRNPLMKQLVRDVVGNDPKRLREFMLDLQNASPKDRASAIRYLTDKQRDVLQRDAYNRLAQLEKDKKELAELNPPPVDMHVKLARLDAEIANVNTELGVFVEIDPKMAARALAIAPSIGEHYIARMDKLETRLKSAEEKKLNKPKMDQEVKDAEAAREAALDEVNKLDSATPSEELKRYLEARKALDNEIKALEAVGENTDTQLIAKKRAAVVALATLIPDGPEKVAAEKLESADKKLLEAKKEQKLVNDDPVKLRAEFDAAKAGLLKVKVAGTNPALLQKFWARCAPEVKVTTPEEQKKHSEELKAVSELLAPEQQKALTDGYVRLLPELSEGLSQAEQQTAAARDDLRAELDRAAALPSPLSSPSPEFGQYVEAQRKLVNKQDALEALEKNLREKEEHLAQEQQKPDGGDKAVVDEVEGEISQTKANIEKARKEVAALQAQVAKAQKPQKPFKAPEETTVIEKIEKLAQGLLDKREKQKEAAGKLAAAERQLGEFIGSTNMPADVAKTVITAKLNPNSTAMVTEWARGISDTLHPDEAKKLKAEAKKQSAAKPGAAPKQHP